VDPPELTVDGDITVTDWMAPGTDEYGQFYAGYVARAGADHPFASMERQIAEVEALCSVGDDTAATPPGAGEWSMKQVLGHLCDFERVFSYRALRFSRGDEAPLLAFEQDSYVAAAGSDARPLGDLIDEFVLLRRATLLMFRAMDGEALARSGVASDAVMSVRAVATVTTGHTWVHLDSLWRDYPGAAGGASA
jgi:hypothetical protein